MMSYYCQLVTFIDVFSTEFNSTVPSRLSGKMINPLLRIKYDILKFCLVRIITSEEEQICQAVLLTDNSIVMTEGCSNRPNAFQAVLINSKKEMQKITLGRPIAEECRIIRGIDVVQVKVSK